jgi:1-pyrroline-5-carboxylate dehydrogenase
MAAEGVMRSAFGLSGQKCSAASRVYVDREVHDRFIDLLKTKAESIAVGDPTDKRNWMGPVINSSAVARYESAADEAAKTGRVVTGGKRLPGDGYFVAPTVVADLPDDSRLLRDELFLPFVVVAPVESIDEGFQKANENILGLTAGFYSDREEEVRKFLDVVEAGVVYVNRRAGATTGAWPGVQPFGGWKGSGATGKSSGGHYYVQQFMREQSQTIVR